jgi:DNA-binding transcriptional LysR family regulator
VLIGDPLVIKKGRGIVPTPKALELGPVLAKALRELQEAVQGGAFDPATTTRGFTLALADAGQVVLLPRIASLLTAEMPNAQFRAIGIDSLVSLGGLGSTEVDAVVGPAEKVPDIHLEPLYREPTVLICRKDHPAAARAQLTLRHVAIDMVAGRSTRDLTGAAYARAGVTRNVAMVVPSFSAAAAIVAATDLVATVPSSLYEVLGPRLGLRTLAAPIPPLFVTMKLSWHERTHADPAATGFRDLVRRAVTTIPALSPNAAHPDPAPNSGAPVSLDGPRARKKRRGRRSSSYG